MRRLILMLAISLLGCVKVDPPVSQQVADRVYTVDEFIAQPDLRKKVFALCSSDPGRKGSDPNCINVTRAERISSYGTLSRPKS